MATVLIVDSEAEVANSLSEALSSRGVQTIVSSDGTEGLNTARSENPDVIVLCVELTRVSGYSICNKLKKDPALATIPLILTSSQATEETFEQHKKLKTRAEQYLRKPFELNQILGLVAQYIDVASGDEEVDDFDVSVEGDMDVDLGGGNADFSSDVTVGAPTASDLSVDDVEAQLAATTSRATGPVERATTGSLVSDAEVERMRGELRKLRQKNQQLEQQMEEKELEYNERLLQESGRARDSVELKKRITQLERDMGKHQQAVREADGKLAEARSRIEEQAGDIQRIEEERQALSDKLAQLVDKVKSLARERDELRGQLENAQQGQQRNSEEVEHALKVRQKAKKAVDIAMQLLEEASTH